MQKRMVYDVYRNESKLNYKIITVIPWIGNKVHKDVVPPQVKDIVFRRGGAFDVWDRTELVLEFSQLQEWILNISFTQAPFA